MAIRPIDLLRRLRVAQSDDRLELERLNRMRAHIAQRMENRLLEIENLETALNLNILTPEQAA